MRLSADRVLDHKIVSPGRRIQSSEDRTGKRGGKGEIVTIDIP
jgi:hypothetical protein